MGSEEKDPCLKDIGKNSRDYLLYEDICPKKTVFLAMASPGIVGPKFRVTISGDERLVNDIHETYLKSLR